MTASSGGKKLLLMYKNNLLALSTVVAVESNPENFVCVIDDVQYVVKDDV